MTRREMLNSKHNMGANGDFTHIKFGGFRSRDRNFRHQNLAKSGQFEISIFW